MSQKRKFLIIYCSYGNLDVVKQTLPTVLNEVKRYRDAALIIHDSTERKHGRKAKWKYLMQLEDREEDIYLMLSTNISMAHSRNMCLALGQELVNPDYVAMMEDDHGFREGFLDRLEHSMHKSYGKESPNGLLYGLYTGCLEHRREAIAFDPQFNLQYVPIESDPTPGVIGGVNSCFRCSPIGHWVNVLKGYDIDEYLISEYQTKNLVYRNYNKGFCSAVVGSGELMFSIRAAGRGTSDSNTSRLWDNDYCASDPRSKYRGR